MALPDGLRQVLAGLLAGGAFLGLYFGIGLVWWLALLLAGAVYFALLLVIQRRKPSTEIMVTSRVSEADLKAGGEALQHAAARLEQAAQKLPESEQAGIAEMAQHLLSIRQNVIADPQDFRSTRRFIVSYLPSMVDTVENYASLSERAGPKHRDRLAAAGATIRGFIPMIEEIDRACLENDFNALDVQVAALATQMDRG